MKARILAILGAVIFCAACSHTGTYNIDGTVTLDDGTEVYLIDLNGPDGGDTLGVTTVGGGKFAFTGKTAKPVYAYIGRERKRIRAILEPGTLVVNIDEYSTEGTPLEDQGNTYNEEFYSFDKVRREARQALADRKANLTPEEFNSEWDNIEAAWKEKKIAICDSMIRANKDNLLGAMVMNDLSMVDPEAFLEHYDLLTKEMKEHVLVSKPYSLVKAFAETGEGKPFIDYTVPGGNPDGTDVKLSDYVGKGKFILVDHWASWCGPCKAEMPHIKKAYDAFHGEKFDVVSVAVSDKREDTEAALAKLDMPWNQIMDAQKVPGELYGFNAIPHLILFGPDGTIVKRGLRGEQIYATMEELLK
ncbi:MAG: AhpC/TSA family protein [Bacteroidales bacterium]|nr:AhpC/TSA family protein [Bacteroidales bacterium]